MTKILDFTYRDKPYTIYDVDKIEGKDSYIGETNYDNGRILIEKGSRQEMLDTLKHELAHVWLYENGHTYQAGGCFTYEDMCEYIAFSNRFVFDISEMYKKKKIGKKEAIQMTSKQALELAELNNKYTTQLYTLYRIKKLKEEVHR